MKDGNLNIKRAFASFNGKCPFKCLHCYTYVDNFSNNGLDSISDIVNSLEKETFDIIYISGYKENFLNPSVGIDLIEDLYSKYKCHILFTTRNVFNDEEIYRLAKINNIMRKNNRLLYACVTISAGKSYKKVEPNALIPSPHQRINFVKKLYQNNIITFLTLRPVFPESFIPTNEYIDIIEETQGLCNAVIYSGIVVNDTIKQNLKTFPTNYKYFEKPLMDCLKQDNIIMHYVDVSNELSFIEKKCKDCSIPFFSESMDAVKHFILEENR